ncbi:hypothetical protein FQN51_001524 [Onygenales sp. PD_10]|nr:hypothetical protein FQN51_001524 [Onygenales sp. PD_10]
MAIQAVLDHPVVRQGGLLVALLPAHPVIPHPAAAVVCSGCLCRPLLHRMRAGEHPDLQPPVRLLLWCVLCGLQAPEFVYTDHVLPGGCDSPHETWMQSVNVIFSTAVDVATDIMIMGAVDLVGLAIWGAVEMATAIVVGCLPPLKSLVSRSLKKYHTTRMSSSNRQRRNYYGHSQSHHTTDNLNPADPYLVDGIQSHPAVVSESIPLDSSYGSGHTDGAIYIQKMFTTTVTKTDS